MSRGQGILPRLLPTAFAPALCLAAGLSFLQAASAGGKVQRQHNDSATGGPVVTSIDRVHPEAFRVATWVEVDLPASDVALRGLRVLTANRSWTLQICGSTLDLSTCTTVVGPVGTAPGWKGDFSSEGWSFAYQDREGRRKLHLRVTPVGGDWMIFRIQMEARQ